MTVSVGDTIRFTGFNPGCGTDQVPKQGSEGIVAGVLAGGCVLVNWSRGVTTPTGGPAGRLLFSGEYAVTYRANPVDEPVSEPLPIKPTPSVTLYAQQVGRGTRIRCERVARAPWWQRLLNPARWYGPLVWMSAGATVWNVVTLLLRAYLA